jgi:hypothetical protein
MKEDLKLLLAIVVTGGVIYYIINKNTKAVVTSTVSNNPPILPPATLPPGTGELMQMDAPKVNFARKDNFANMASTELQNGAGGFFGSQKVKLNY